MDEQLPPDERAETGVEALGVEAADRSETGRVKLWPRTAASQMSDRSPGSSASRRAAMSAWSVAGTARSARSKLPTSLPALPSVPSATSIRMVSTAYRGMPSARAMMVARPAPGRPGASASRISPHGLVAKRLEGEAHEGPRSRPPAGPAFDQLRPSEGHDGQGHAAAPVEQVVDEVEQSGVRPMEVLEQEDDRVRIAAMRSKNARQALNSSSRAAPALPFEPEQDEEGVLDPAAFGLVGDPARDTGRDRGPGRRLVVAFDEADRALGPSRRVPRT